MIRKPGDPLPKPTTNTTRPATAATPPTTARPTPATTTTRPAKTTAVDGTRALPRDEAARMQDAGERQLQRAAAKHAPLLEAAQAAATALRAFTQLCVDGKGDLRRSAALEHAALKLDAVGQEAAVMANIAAAKLGTSRQAVGAKGVIGPADRAELKHLQTAHAKLSGDADATIARAAAGKADAAKLRGDELTTDMTALAGKTSVVDKRQRWRGARDALQAFTAKHGDAPVTPALQHELKALQAEKSVGWRTLLAEHKKAKVLDTSAQILAEGRGSVTVEQAAALEQKITRIVAMQKTADELAGLAKSERLLARGARAAESTTTSSSSSSSSSSAGATDARPNGGAGDTWAGAFKVLADAFKQGFAEGRAKTGRAGLDDEQRARAQEQGFVFGKEATDGAKGKTGSTLFGLREAIVSSMRDEPIGRILADALRL